MIEQVTQAESRISTVSTKTGLMSDQVLAHLAPGLGTLGYLVESGKRTNQKITQPVLFGVNGRPEVSYEIDGWHKDLGVVLEVEAGRGALGNATYRNLVRASLIVDARYLALLVPVAYRRNSLGRQVVAKAYDEGLALLSALYASQRLKLPFEGVLLVGY